MTSGTQSGSSIGQGAEILYGDPTGVRLGFGCAGLMRSPRRARRQELLGAAFEAGIRHFDVARMYGLGAAEAELGRFARGRRGEISIATKFGIEPAGAAGRLAPLQAPARAAISRLPALRRRLKSRDSSFHRARRYDGRIARASVERSLRELGTDYVDVLFVHDPSAVDELDAVELGAALEDLRQAGTIRAWGVSGEAGPSLRLAAEWPGCQTQLRDDFFDPAPVTDAEPPAISFGVLAGALGRLTAWLGRDEAARRDLSHELGAECDAGALAALLLQDALARNRRGGVLFATSQPSRVAAATAAADAVAGDPGPAGPAALRRFVTARAPASVWDA